MVHHKGRKSAPDFQAAIHNRAATQHNSASWGITVIFTKQKQPANSAFIVPCPGTESIEKRLMILQTAMRRFRADVPCKAFPGSLARRRATGQR